MQTRIIVTGINHKTAPVSIREKFSLNTTQQALLLSELKNRPEIVEAFVLSTCNRVEVYAHVLDNETDEDIPLKDIFSIKGIPLTAEMKHYFYRYSGRDAIEHLLRVSVGLDSLVLGEKQILGQIKDSIHRAQTMTMFSRHFNILSNIAIRAGKKAHTETDIGYGGSSVSWATVNMAEKILGTLRDKSVLLIGAGKMGELTVKQVQNKGVQEIYLINRTRSKAEELARKCNATAAAFCDIKEILGKVDVCICSSAAPHYILDKETLREIISLRKNPKLVLVDISVPRNIDPRVAELKDVQLFTIDDLDKVVGETMRKREAAVSQVEHIIEKKITEFHEKIARSQIAKTAVG